MAFFFLFSSLDRKKEQREGGGKVSVDTARGVARHAHSILRRERLPLDFGRIKEKEMKKSLAVVLSVPAIVDQSGMID